MDHLLFFAFCLVTTSDWIASSSVVEDSWFPRRLGCIARRAGVWGEESGAFGKLFSAGGGREEREEGGIGVRVRVRALGLWMQC